ncbi:unnamed protein product [Blepharisma stoltei]|uniref:Uncharacterized protein n=1 Tax=Blepharisma stoltei TaxID=1481888 RepID=A0AAU9ISJ7_9CILI|nr:unnamed protein product [Blepharisma stoltei]
MEDFTKDKYSRRRLDLDWRFSSGAEKPIGISDVNKFYFDSDWWRLFSGPWWDGKIRYEHWNFGGTRL